MRYLLIKAKDDWADEFDFCSVRAIAVYDDEYNDFFKALERLKTKTAEEVNFYFGTNEETDYANGEQFYNTIEVQEITSDEYNTLCKFGLNDYGNYDIVYQIIED